MVVFVSNLIILKVFMVVADGGDRNRLQCGGGQLLPAEAWGLLFLRLVSHSWKESYWEYLASLGLTLLLFLSYF